MKKIVLAIAALLGAFVLFLFIYIRSLDISYIRDKVKIEIENNINGQVSIGDLSISGLKSLVLQNLVISQNGEKTFVLDSLSFDLTLSDLVKSKLSFSSIDLSGLQIYLRKNGESYNFQNLLKASKPVKPSKKKVLSMVAGTDLSPLAIDSIAINSAKIYFGDIHLLGIEANGNLVDGKLNFPSVKISKDKSYINSKFFLDLNSQTGVLQLQENLIDLARIGSFAGLESNLSKGRAVITGDVKFTKELVEPKLVVKVDELNLSNQNQKLKFKPIEILIQSDKIYSNISGSMNGGSVECNLDLRKKGSEFIFKETNFNLDLDLQSYDNAHSGNVIVRASISGPLNNPTLESKLNGKALSLGGVTEVFGLSGVASGTLSRFKLDHLNLIGNMGSKLALSASLSDRFKTGLGLVSGSLTDLSQLSPELKGSLLYNGEFNITNGMLAQSLLQVSTKKVSFGKENLPNVSADLKLHTNAESLVIQRSPILLANSQGEILLDARLPFNGDMSKAQVQLRGKSLVLRNLPYVLLPITVKELYVSNKADKFLINKLIGQVAGGQFSVSGLIDPKLPIDDVFNGSVNVKSLNLAKVSNELPSMIVDNFTLKENKQFKLSLKTKSQNFVSKGVLSSDYKKLLLSNASNGGLDLSVFNAMIKKLGYKGISGVLTINTNVDSKSKLLVASIAGKSLVLPMSKDLELLPISKLDSQATFNPYSNQLDILSYNVNAFGGTALGKGTVLLDSDRSSKLSCKLNAFDLNAFLTWVSKSLAGHFYSKINGDIPNFSFNPKTADINDISFSSNLALAQVKYVYHQSVLDSIKGIEDSLGPKALRKYIKKKRTGFQEKSHHFILFKDVSSLKVSMQKSNLEILPFDLVEKSDDYKFYPNVPIKIALMPDKIKSKINGQLSYSFSNVFLKDKFPFLKKDFMSSLDGVVHLNGELGLPVTAQEQSRLQKEVAGKLARAVDLGFLGKQIENGVRKLKNSKEIKDKIKNVKENFIDSIKSGKGKSLLQGLFGSKKKKNESGNEVKEKKEDFKSLLKGLF